MTYKALVIEDEQDIRELISFHLKNLDLETTCFENAEKALIEINKNKDWDLILVDWMLPGTYSGLDFIKKIRQDSAFKTTPIMMITALTQNENIVQGLDAGADDYLTKPFDQNVLKARIKVQIRTLEKKNQKPEHLIFNNLKLSTKSFQVYLNEIEVPLTLTEKKIIFLLAKSIGHVFTREQLINQIQGENVHVTGRTIDTHVAGLRKKLLEYADVIETIRGIGYRFKDLNEEK